MNAADIRKDIGRPSLWFNPSPYCCWAGGVVAGGVVVWGVGAGVAGAAELGAAAFGLCTMGFFTCLR
jgi:hypothetical protein